MELNTLLQFSESDAELSDLSQDEREKAMLFFSAQPSLIKIQEKIARDVRVQYAKIGSDSQTKAVNILLSDVRHVVIEHVLASVREHIDRRKVLENMAKTWASNIVGRLELYVNQQMSEVSSEFNRRYAEIFDDQTEELLRIVSGGRPHPKATGRVSYYPKNKDWMERVE